MRRDAKPSALRVSSAYSTSLRLPSTYLKAVQRTNRSGRVIPDQCAPNSFNSGDWPPAPVHVVGGLCTGPEVRYTVATPVPIHFFDCLDAVQALPPLRSSRSSTACVRRRSM